MACYNGERFVRDQVASILSQLAVDDELIVVDDCSTDGTVAVLRGVGDSRLTVHRNDRNRGEVYSFSRAMSLARHDVLFLSDQDDLWMPGRVEMMLRGLAESGADVVSSNFVWMDVDGRELDVSYDGVRAVDSERHLRNIRDIFIGRTNYFGCAMALRRRLVPIVTPIPAFVESHDLWIALASNLFRSNVHLDAKTLRKRKHGGNATSTISTRSLYRKLRARAIFALSIVTLLRRKSRQSAPASPGGRSK